MKDYTRFKVTYLAKSDGKRRVTEISADTKVQAALFLKETIAKEVLKVTPIFKEEVNEPQTNVSRVSSISVVE